MRRVILQHRLALGDVVVLSGLVRDLATQYAGRVEVAVDTTNPLVWRHNPHVVPTPPAKERRRDGWESYRLTYGAGIGRAGRGEYIHFLRAFHADFERQSGLAVEVGEPHPDLHLGPDEGPWPGLPPRYWVVMAGGKNDFTTKHPVFRRQQTVVDLLTGLGLPCVQIGGRGSAPEHVHYPLAGATDLVGRTDVRGMFRVIAHADGVVCTITSAMHIAAAFGRPCVVTAGGREEPWWEGYVPDYGAFGPASGRLRVPHRYLHTQGLLPCSPVGKACWRSKVLAKPGDRSQPCHRPVRVLGQDVAACQALLSAEVIVENALWYYAAGILTPPEGAAVPHSPDRPVTFDLPDGRRAVVRVELAGPDPERVSLPVLPEAPPPPTPLPPALPPRPAEVAGNRPGPVAAGGPAADMTGNRPGPVAAPQPAGGPIRVIDLTPGRRPALPPEPSPLDHPAVGGRLTLFVLCYGREHAATHRRCLEAIRDTCPAARLDWRLYLNAVGPETADLAEELRAAGRVRHVYRSAENKYKYPAMREMFHDPERPIETRWLVWMDDDTFVDRDALWLEKLARQVVAADEPKLGAVGLKQIYSLTGLEAEWLKAARWYRGRPFRDAAGRAAPGGTKVHFPTGSFWALKTECVRGCDIPDLRLKHNGGDVCIGEQLYQAGYTLKHWAEMANKQVVAWSAVPRRGYREGIFGLKSRHG